MNIAGKTREKQNQQDIGPNCSTRKIDGVAYLFFFFFGFNFTDIAVIVGVGFCHGFLGIERGL